MKLTWMLLLSLAAATVALAKTEPSKPRVEVCFVLDTTGSMGGLIEGAKQKIWHMANQIISAKPTPEVRLALIGYRDRGDEYVTKLFDLTDDIDAVYGNLRGFAAGGGGDTPESVNQALHEAVTKISWSQSRDVLKIVFLVGDAPPHMDYKDDVKYPEVCQLAVKRDLIINTVQCGNIAGTREIWQEIAKLAEGTYTAIAQDGAMASIATPMDDKIAKLNKEIGGTLIGYGAGRRGVMAKQLAAESAPAPAMADRLAYNAASGKTVQGSGELIDAIASGIIRVEDVKKDQLPDELRKLSDTELKAYVEKKQTERSALQAQLTQLLKQREEFIAAERNRLSATGKGDAFDEKVAETIRTQAARKGIRYE